MRSSLTTHDIELVFMLLVLNVLVDLLKSGHEGAPALLCWTVPYEDVALIGDRRYRRFMRMPLKEEGYGELSSQRVGNLHAHM